MSKEPLCKSLLVDNIAAVEEGRELTAPLRQLNESCEFKAVWKRHCNIMLGEDIGKKEKRAGRKEYLQRPEVKARIRRYCKDYYKTPKNKERIKKYYQIPKNKERMRRYQKEYNKNPKVKERKRRYMQRPEVKEKKKEASRKHYQKRKMEKLK